MAEGVMAGEIAFRSGDIDEGLKHLGAAAAREDALRYDEPRDWIQPVRHPWGAALLQAGRAREAEAVFTRDLEISPENGWGLYGLLRALTEHGQRRATVAWMLTPDDNSADGRKLGYLGNPNGWRWRLTATGLKSAPPG